MTNVMWAAAIGTLGRYIPGTYRLEVSVQRSADELRPGTLIRGRCGILAVQGSQPGAARPVESLPVENFLKTRSIREQRPHKSEASQYLFGGGHG